jgi:metal-sulfur cluster biosynthetic enzyme
MATDTELIEALKQVIDPELMVNIVDLGLIYSVDDVDEATITITLSPPWTPDRMTDDAKDMLGIF